MRSVTHVHRGIETYEATQLQRGSKQMRSVTHMYRGIQTYQATQPLDIRGSTHASRNIDFAGVNEKVKTARCSSVYRLAGAGAHTVAPGALEESLTCHRLHLDAQDPLDAAARPTVEPHVAR